MTNEVLILRSAASVLSSMGYRRDAAKLLRLAKSNVSQGSEIGSFLLRFRSKFGLTQLDMASRVNLPLSTYLTVEYNKHSPSRRTLNRIEAFLGNLDRSVLENLGPLPDYVNTKVA